MGNISIPGIWFWTFFALAIFSIVVLVYAARSNLLDGVFLRSPLSEPDEGCQTPPPAVPRLTYYSVGNVRVGKVYPITISEKTAQTLCVRQIFAGSFLIVVHTADDGNGPYPSFNGWAVQIPTNRLIRPENLLPHQPY